MTTTMSPEQRRLTALSITHGHLPMAERIEDAKRIEAYLTGQPTSAETSPEVAKLAADWLNADEAQIKGIGYAELTRIIRTLAGSVLRQKPGTTVIVTKVPKNWRPVAVKGRGILTKGPATKPGPLEARIPSVKEVDRIMRKMPYRKPPRRTPPTLAEHASDAGKINLASIQRSNPRVRPAKKRSRAK